MKYQILFFGNLEVNIFNEKNQFEPKTELPTKQINSISKRVNKSDFLNKIHTLFNTFRTKSLQNLSDNPPGLPLSQKSRKP